MRRVSSTRAARAAAVAAVVLGVADSVFAATTRTWDNGAGSSLWSGISNWSGNVEPTSVDPVIFPTPIPLGDSTLSLSTGEECDNITFNASYSLGGGNLRLFGAGGNITTASGVSAAITSPIIGSVGLTKGGNGTLTLSTVGTSTFTGDVNISGTLAITKDSSLGNSSNQVIIGPGAVSGAVLQANGSMTLSSLRTISPGILGGSFNANSGAFVTLNGPLGGLSNPITFAGLGTINLGANSTRSGLSHIQNGTVRLTIGGALGSGGTQVTNGTLELGNAITHANFIGLKSGGRFRTTVANAVHSGTILVDPSVTVTLNSGDDAADTLQLGGPGTNQYTGGAGSTTVVNGPGTITMLTASNDYAGAWQIDAGILRFAGGGSLGAGTSAVVVNNGATLQPWSVTLNRDVTLNTGSTLAFESGGQSYGVHTIAPAASVTMALKGVASEIVGDGANDITGGAGATINVTSDTSGNKIELFHGNNYAGGWSIGTSAAVRVAHADGLGTGTSAVAVQTFGTLQVSGVTLNRDVNIATQSTLEFANGAQSLGTHTISAAAQPSFVLKGAANATLGDAGNDLTGGSGSTIFVYGDTAGNTLILNQSSNYVGGWTINLNGTVRVGHPSALGSGAVLASTGGKLEIDNVTLDRVVTIQNGGAVGGIGTNARSNGTMAVSGAASAVTIGTGASPTDVFTLGDGVNDLTGGGASSSITVNGAGKVVLTQPSNYTGLWALSGGTLEISANDQLGTATNPVSLFSGGTLSTTATFNSTRTISPGGGSISNAAGTTLTLNNALGSGSAALTKAGTGTLQLSAASARTGATTINAGTVRLSSGAGLGTGNATVNNGGTLEIAGTAASNGGIILNDGGTLRATGTATYSQSGFPAVANAAANVNMTVAAASDVLNIGSAIRSVNAVASTSTVHVNGTGLLRLQAGGTASTDIFGGSWEQSAGMLQVGQTTGSAINALGFKNGDPKQANTITVNGGTLMIGALGSGANTPAFLRAGVVLAGGNIAATNSVTAQYGGDFTTAAATTSKALLFDPLTPASSRSMLLVAGAAGVDNNASTTHWAGTLVLDPGTTSGGTFTINRTGGTFLVDPGAAIQVNAGATLVLDGVDSLTDGVDHVNIVNNSTTSGNVMLGSRNVGNIDGTGKTFVPTFATLTASRIRQSVLQTHDDGTVRIRPSGSADAATSVLGTFPNIVGTGVLDLADNKLVVNGSFSIVETLVKVGRNGGTWDGAGAIITSMTDALPASLLTTLAVADNAVLGKSTFGGQSVTGADTLVMYTYLGDADLSGFIDGDDFFRIDAGYNGSLLGYINGDFNYSSTIDADDYWLIDRNYSRNLPAIEAAPIAGVTTVPEPSCALTLMAIGLLRRRRAVSRNRLARRRRADIVGGVIS